MRSRGRSWGQVTVNVERAGAERGPQRQHLTLALCVRLRQQHVSDYLEMSSDASTMMCIIAFLRLHVPANVSLTVCPSYRSETGISF
jgi:hypothetical protein